MTALRPVSCAALVAVAWLALCSALCVLAAVGGCVRRARDARRVRRMRRRIRGG